MELAKITSKGQITIPVAIRRMLGVKDGDKVLFVQEGNKVVISMLRSMRSWRHRRRFRVLQMSLALRMSRTL